MIRVHIYNFHFLKLKKKYIRKIANIIIIEIVVNGDSFVLQIAQPFELSTCL